MNRDSKELLIIVISAIVVVAVVMSALMLYSGMSRPLTVVESKSMQHSDTTSYLGIIDTGDMVVMISPDKRTPTTYVEGYQNGHCSFGSYGDVIIYYRGNGQNPVIHRAIIWLDYNDGVISAPSLKDYPADKWSNEGTWDNLTGDLILKDLPYKGGSRDVTMDLTRVTHEGYLTMGDNNGYFDQMSMTHPEPVMKSELKAIAGLEVPWLGCIKLLINNKNTNMIPDNSLNCLLILVLDIIAFFSVAIVTTEYVIRHRDIKNNEETIE